MRAKSRKRTVSKGFPYSSQDPTIAKVSLDATAHEHSPLGHTAHDSMATSTLNLWAYLHLSLSSRFNVLEAPSNWPSLFRVNLRVICILGVPPPVDSIIGARILIGLPLVEEGCSRMNTHTNAFPFIKVYLDYNVSTDFSLKMSLLI